MADIITSNLYPPIIDTFMPAFTTDNCKIYFSLSDFNSISDIDQYHIQVSVVNQKSNINSLKVKTGIANYELQEDNDGYYIEIEKNDLEDERFYLDQYYKVQIRFISSSLNDPIPLPYTNQWLNEHLTFFSEWSTVCLIRQISEPKLKCNISAPLEEGDPYMVASPFLKFRGVIKFDDIKEEEYVSEYQLILYNDEQEIIEDSGIKYTSSDEDINQIKYDFHTLLFDFMEDENEEDENVIPNVCPTFSLEVKIITNNLYTKTFTFDRLQSFSENASNAGTRTINTEVQPDQGRNKITYTVTDPDSNNLHFQYLVITRTSSRSNFKYWEDIAVIRREDIIIDNNIDNIYYDSSIESGIWYMYGIYWTVDNYINISKMKVTLPQINLFEDMFLNSQNIQLKMRYDSRITSYKINVNETKTDTLGSRYPFIRRNSAMNYKQFSINGLITFHTDDENIFTSESDLYNHNENRYKIFNDNERINQYNDYVKEREFREKVFNFLSSGKAFLLRTLTEGNILVRLMDINATPNQSLNNYIYTFTATVYEIGECSLENYYKYNIFSQPYTIEQL